MCFLNCSKVPSNRAFPTPNSFCPSWPDCHSFHSSICYNHTDTLWYFCFKQFPFRAIKTKKNQRIFIFIYSFSDTPLFFLFFFCRSEFLTYIIFFLSKELFFFNISGKTGLLVMNSLHFCLTENLHFSFTLGGQFPKV